MSSTDYFNSFNLLPQFMDSKFGYFKAGEEIKIEDDAENVLSEQPFFQNSHPWNPVATGRSDVSQMSPGNVTNAGYNSFEDIVSKILDEESPELKVDCADKFGRTNLDKISNENNNHGVFSPIPNSLFNPNGCLTDNDLGQTSMQPNMQANDYKNFFNPPKPNFTNQVDNGIFNLQQSFNNFNNSNPGVNYLNFLALQNAFFTNPELFKSAMNPSFPNVQNICQFNILDNLLNANGMKQSMSFNGFNQLNRQAPMPFQNQKNVFFSGNSSYRLNVPTYKQSPQLPMDNMAVNYNLNQQNQQLFNNSMHYKNQMDPKVNNNLPNHSTMLYVELCMEQLNLLSIEELKMSCELEGNSSREGKSRISADTVHMKLNNLITESFSLHYKVSVLLKKLVKHGEGQVEKGVQSALDAWLEVLTRLQNKYKEELISNIGRPAALSYNEGLCGTDMGSCLGEVHKQLRRVRTALWCMREAACNHISPASNTAFF